MKNSIKAIPNLNQSQLSFRIGLARERTGRYPMDDMNFITMDLERPDQNTRHAHWCTGDLTGRTLEFLSTSDGIDGISDERLTELFTRVLNSQRKSGLIGRYVDLHEEAVDYDTELIEAGINKLLTGLMRYYRLKKDSRALDAAIKIADIIINNKNKIIEKSKVSPSPLITWIFEPFAFLYEATMDKKYLDFFESVVPYIPDIKNSHSHSFLTTLRGMQTWSMITGDNKWSTEVEKLRTKIINEDYEMADGCISEVFPRSFRNEGCSIGDWMTINLNAGFINNDDSAYEKAENILWNALFFNQFVTGGFGHRDLTPIGYSDNGFSECWWCCTENCGMAMSEFARHVVTYVDGEVHINFMIPGSYTIPMENTKDIVVHITTTYPEQFDGFVQVENLPEETQVKVRIPSFVKNSSVEECVVNSKRHISIKGKLGHYVTEKENNIVLKYGPLILSPSVYYWENKYESVFEEKSVPAGYMPSVLPGKRCTILCNGYDENGFLKFESEPLPDWSYFDEGVLSRTAVKGAAINVETEFENGEKVTLRFTPLCYNTSNLSYYSAPILFPEIKIL